MQTMGVVGAGPLPGMESVRNRITLLCYLTPFFYHVCFRSSGSSALPVAIALTVPYFFPRQSEACGVVTQD